MFVLENFFFHLPPFLIVICDFSTSNLNILINKLTKILLLQKHIIYIPYSGHEIGKKIGVSLYFVLAIQKYLACHLPFCLVIQISQFLNLACHLACGTPPFFSPAYYWYCDKLSFLANFSGQCLETKFSPRCLKSEVITHQPCTVVWLGKEFKTFKMDYYKNYNFFKSDHLTKCCYQTPAMG